MNEGGTTTKTGIHCRGCDYDLRESALRCPECGRAFDAANPKTYFTSPRSRRVRRWVRRIILLLLLILLPPALALGWLWWGWEAELKAIAALEPVGLGVSRSEPLYPWLPRLLPERWRFLADRTAGVGDRRPLPEPECPPLPQELMPHLTSLKCLRELTISGMQATDQDVHELCGLPRLEEITLTGPAITDQALADLAGTKRMEGIALYQTSITSPGLRQLAALPRLKLLALDGAPIDDDALVPIGEMKQLELLLLDRTRITDAGMKRLAGLTQLRGLSLEATKVGDEGLKCLAGMTTLEAIVLNDTAVTDAGLEHLRGLVKLHVLALDGVCISLAAEQRLRTALPQLSIVGEPQRPDAPAPATVPAPAGGN